jgi:hypothetical protein
VASVALVLVVEQSVSIGPEMDVIAFQDRALTVGCGIVVRPAGPASRRDGKEDRRSNPALVQRVDKRVE